MDDTFAWQQLLRNYVRTRAMNRVIEYYQSGQKYDQYVSIIKRKKALLLNLYIKYCVMARVVPSLHPFILFFPVGSSKVSGQR